jgi:hypothetical protein
LDGIRTIISTGGESFSFLRIDGRMTDPNDYLKPTDKSLSLSKVIRVDQISDQFDRAVRDAIENGEPWPSIEDYLGDTTEPVRSELRRELLAVEASFRQQRAEGGDHELPSGTSPGTRLWQP